MPNTSFQENLLQKIELEKLALRVIASIGTGETPHRIDRQSMRLLVEKSPYQHHHERDLDLYILPGEGDIHKILVLDNELPIFRSTEKDVVVRRSPKTLEMWNFNTIRKILNDADIKESKGAESVATVLADTLARLDLSYDAADIAHLARDGMAWLAGRERQGVERTLSMFAALLGYRPAPKHFGLDQAVSYGTATSGPDKESAFGPLVLYRPADNTLMWLDRSFSPKDRQQLESLRSLAAGRTSAPVQGDAVFEKLKTEVLEHPEQVSAALARRGF